MVDPNFMWTVIGSVAGVIGTGIAFVAYNYSKRQVVPKVKVQIGVGFMAIGRVAGPNVLTVATANDGQAAVSIVSQSILLPGNRFIPLLPPYAEYDYSLPCLLGQGQACRAVIPIRDIALALYKRGKTGTVKIVAQGVDATGRRYKSRPFKFNIDGWLKCEE